MKAKIFGLVALIASIIGLVSFGAGAQTPPKNVALPLSRPQAQYFAQHPQELQQLQDQLSQAAQQFKPAPALPAGVTPAPGTWTTGTGMQPAVAVQNPILMTDGTVIATQPCSGHWYKLTPDITGSYVNGTWAPIATMPSGYGPLFVGSGVLNDGRVIVEGGEYNNSSQSGNCGSAVWTSLGALYDPVANSWQAVSAPSGWTIGDASGIVLDNGTYMQTACCTTASGVSGASALFNESMCCTSAAWTATGSGKLDRWDEEGMAKLQNGNVLVVDAHTNTSCTKTSEIYNAGTGTFSATGNTVDQEADCSNPGNNGSYELGPLVTRPDGSAVIFPGLTCSDVANSSCSSQANGFVVVPNADLYNPGSGTWSTLATLPRLGTAPNNYYYDLADAPATVLPDGNVLFAASPDYQAFVGPTHFFELVFGTTTITQVGDTADAAGAGAYVQNFLLLPTGQVLGVSQLGNIQYYTPLAGSPQASWAPVVTSAPSCASPSHTYTLAGTQLNGLTEGSYYGDDVQGAVNLPIVRIVNNATGHVFYARTANANTRSIAPGASVTVNFTVAANTETGASTLYEVGAGIPSSGTGITVSASCLVDSHDFNGDSKSDVLWRDTLGDIGMWLMNGTTIAQSSGVGSVPSVWTAVGQRDFNGDGKADILWTDTSGDVGMWLMNGTAIAQSSGVGSVGTSWSVAGTGDFDGDGKGDILWHDTSGNVGVWLMSGTTIVQAAAVGNTPPSVWSIAGVGDFNGDGKSDILWIDTSGNVGIWFMNGTQIAFATGIAQAPPGWSIVGTGDFNGDGASDILWRDTAGDLGIWFIDTVNKTVQAVGIGNVPNAWSVVETGDFNGDGKSDILWYNSGTVGMWLMNGAAITTATTVGSAPAIWTIQSAGAD